MVGVVVDVRWLSLIGCMSGQRAGSSVPSRVLGSGYVAGLVAALERKNGWTLAEHAGPVAPDGMQRLLRRADWGGGRGWRWPRLSVGRFAVSGRAAHRCRPVPGCWHGGHS